MSLTVPTQHFQPTLHASAVLNGLSAEVSREAGQSQLTMQNARAFSGAQSTNTLEENAQLIQNGSAANEKKIEIALPADSVEILQSQFDSLGRAVIDQNQGTHQRTFASGMNAAGQPSRAVNNLGQTENVEQNLNTVLTNTVTAGSGPALEQPQAAALPQQSLGVFAPAIRTGSQAPSLTAPAQTPAAPVSFSRTGLSIRDELSRLLPAFNFSLASFGTPLSPTPSIRDLPQSPAQPIQFRLEPFNPLSNLSALTPDRLLATLPPVINPRTFLLPLLPRTNGVNVVV